MRALAGIGLLLAACAPLPGEAPPPRGQAPVFERTVGTGEACGGMMGLVCGAPGDFCRMEMSAQCGAADQMGVCSPRPEMCMKVYQPVCGCDGRTYSNACEANGAGTSAAYAGECR